MVTIAGISALALIITACGSSSSTAPAASSTPSTSAPAVSAPSSAAPATSAAPGSSTAPTSSSTGSGPAVAGDDATYCDTIKKDWPNITGKQVSIYAGISGDEGKQLEASWKDFTTCTGATVTYKADKNFEQQIVVQAKSGNAPNLAFVPQPGLLATLVATGKVVEAPAQVGANVDKYWDKGWKTYGTVGGKFYAAPLGASVKSLVWYSPKMFKAKGYTVPTTWAEMIALSDKIAADPDGIKPWCAGVESGVATGWTATDWLEEVVLRQAGPDVYDQWVAHKVKFSDPPIAKALATVATVWKNEKYVNAGIGDGSVASIATTNFADGGLPIQGGKCYMHQQASFYETNFKGTPDVSENGDIFAFYLPAMGDQFGKPVEVAGEFVAAFSSNPEVQAFQYYLTTSHWANNQSKNSKSRISANKGLDIKNVADPINKLSVSIIQDPKTVSRFDASDLMPAAVGSGAEWKQLTNWITGTDDASVLSQIDSAWPTS
ncbi:alpha-glucoside transport system substrate-binding protein [Nakamurella sp. UYEF19]|uniref:ABC transporter substrate-binding protein n=1 Tax=Nakamurella sp. UYEF19 TaxID=1756392 RepID=UPI003398539B